MKKKRLLFVIDDLGSGGGERSLLTVLQLLDYKKYEVDLLVFIPRGLFLKSVPVEVQLVHLNEAYDIFTLPLAKSITKFFLKGNFSFAINRFRCAYVAHFMTGSSRYIDQRVWKYMRCAFENTLPEYDAAIGYLEGKPNFFVADCVKAKIKIGYVHNDYNKLKMDRELDGKFFEKMNIIVSVSEKCCDVLKEVFPEYADKVRMIENITSPIVLKSMSEGDVTEYKKNPGKTLLTIGRLSQQKGYDIAVDAAEILAKNGVEFKWFAIGRGELQAQIEQKIREKNLEDKFILLGERANPYPYIAGCDIYVQPSYFEGKSIAIDEAKCFAKPIVATKFTTVLDQLADGETALLAEIDAASVAEKIMQLISDKELCESLSENLKKEKLGNEEEIEKFYEILD